MSPRGIDPKLTLAIILGASHFPRARDLASGSAFENSAADFRAYLINPGGLGLPRTNALNLFNDNRSSSEMLTIVAEFLTNAQLSSSEEAKPSDLLIYYVGHGGFSRDGQNYFLAVRATNEATPVASSIRISDLAAVILENARFMRRYIILDCCFAAEAYRAFQAVPGQLACSLLLDKIPGRGTALLCASGKNSPAIVPPNQRHTMFSQALLDALRSGHNALGPLICIEELADLIRTQLQSRYPEEWVRPEVHAPNQEEGNLARFPIFPNYSRQVADASMQSPAAVDDLHAPHLLTEFSQTSSAAKAETDSMLSRTVEDLYLKARVHFRKGQWRAARELLVSIQKFDSNYRDTASILLNVRQNENIAQLWADAELAIETKRWTSAALVLRTLVRIDVNGKIRAQRRLDEVLKQIV
jgi:hypothetical protein